MRSRRLLDIPYSPMLIIYVSYYSKISSYLVTDSKRILKRGLVIYPITRRDIYRTYYLTRHVNRNNLCIFAKVAKMLMEDFWAILCKCLSNTTDEYLVIMGGGSKTDIDKLKTIVSRHCWALKDRIIFKFNVSDKERDHVLSSCKILIYPPSTEGLGMPVFESLMLGVPVISARQTALLEFVPPWIYPYREYRDPDFCQALLVNLRQIMMAQDYVINLRRRLFKITLENILYLHGEINRRIRYDRNRNC